MIWSEREGIPAHVKEVGSDRAVYQRGMGI